LPPLENEGDTVGKPRSYAYAVAEVAFGFILLVWLLLVPRHPFLLLGPGAVYLAASPFELAPVWWTFFWWCVAMNVLQLVWRCINLLRGAWQHRSLAAPFEDGGPGDQGAWLDSDRSGSSGEG